MNLHFLVPDDIEFRRSAESEGNSTVAKVKLCVISHSTTTTAVFKVLIRYIVMLYNTCYNHRYLPDSFVSYQTYEPSKTSTLLVVVHCGKSFLLTYQASLKQFSVWKHDHHELPPFVNLGYLQQSYVSHGYQVCQSSLIKWISKSISDQTECITGCQDITAEILRWLRCSFPLSSFSSSLTLQDLFSTFSKLFRLLSTLNFGFTLLCYIR